MFIIKTFEKKTVYYNIEYEISDEKFEKLTEEEKSALRKAVEIYKSGKEIPKDLQDTCYGIINNNALLVTGDETDDMGLSPFTLEEIVKIKEK